MAAQSEPGIIQRSMAEVVGTFLLVFIGAGTATSLTLLLQSGTAAGSLSVALAHGLALLVAIYIIGKISGAHVNPAVTIALVSVGKMNWVDGIYYVVSQLIGATLGALAILALNVPNLALSTGLGAPGFASSIQPLQAAAVEALGAFILVLAVVSTAGDKRSPAGWAGLVIGFALTAGILVTGATTGGALNPARAFGPDLVLTLFGKSANWGQYWVYAVGPIVGGLVAAWLY